MNILIMIRDTSPSKFFKREEKKVIERTIKRAENITSGEIRVHVEEETDKDVFLRSKEIFEKLGMTNTEERNGVLIYLALKNKQFAILGDRGINEKVPEGFWDDVKEEMQKLFKENKFADGISLGIERAGEKLKTFFPYKEGDIDELPDEISEGTI